MKFLAFFIFIAVSFFTFGWYASTKFPQQVQTNKDKKIIDTNPDLSQYSIESLSSAKINIKEFRVEEILSETDKYIAYKFELEFSPDPTKSQIKRTSGRITIPKTSDEVILKPAVVVMLRGYVDKTVYKTGDGSKNASNYLSEHGFITIAPDFLGYGDSDIESSNIFEARFQTYTTVLALFEVLGNSMQNPSLFKGDLDVTTKLINPTSIFIWAHSNGGQIAISTLEITGKNYPTVLWAPVTKQFPYSVLYYTDESSDGGEFIRKELSKFEVKNKSVKFSLTNYIDDINAPIEIHQGENDDAIPLSWTNEFVAKLRQKEKQVSYYIYPLADHNLRPDWDTAMERTLKYFDSKIGMNVDKVE